MKPKPSAMMMKPSNKTASTVVKLVRVLAMAIESETNDHAMRQVIPYPTVHFHISPYPLPSPPARMPLVE